MIRFTFLLFTLLISGVAPAADTILFHNGKEMECHILEYSKERFRILTTDGKTYEGKASKVKSIQFAEPPLVEEPSPKKEINFQIEGIAFPFCETKEQKEDLKQFAQETFDRSIEKIVFHSSHPGGGRYVRVRFRRIHLWGPYYEAAWASVQHIDNPPNWVKKDSEGNVLWGPKKDDVVSGPWFTDKRIERSLTVKYELNESILYLRPPAKEVSYHQILSLLLAIEAKEIVIPEPRPVMIKEDAKELSINISEVRIRGMNLKEGKLQVEIRTHATGRISGDIFIFELREGKWIVIAKGGWVW